MILLIFYFLRTNIQFMSHYRKYFTVIVTELIKFQSISNKRKRKLFSNFIDENCILILPPSTNIY